MSVTSEVNQAKDELDMVLGELNRLEQLLQPELSGDDESALAIGDALDTARFKVRKVRASL